MKPQASSVPSPLLLHLGSNGVPAHGGKRAKVGKSLPRKLLKNVADGAALKGGESLKRRADGSGKGDVNPRFSAHRSGGWDHIGATKQEEKTLNCNKREKYIDEGPQRGHNCPMPKKTAPAVTTPLTAPTSKKHKFYAAIWLVEALDKLAKQKNKSRSEIISRLVKRHLRINAPKMRKARIELPPELFQK